MDFERKELTLGQKVFLLKNYYRSAENLIVARSEFQSTFEIETNEGMLKIIQKLVERFEATGTVQFTIFFESKEVPQEAITIPDSDKLEEPGDSPLLEQQECENLKICSSVNQNVAEEEVLDEEVVPELFTIMEVPEKKKDIILKMPRKFENSAVLCGICDKSVSRAALSKHMKLHGSSQPHLCDICNKSFKSHNSLKEHKQTHIPIELRRKFECPTCGKKAVNNSNLKKHMQIHTGLKNYVCEWCGKEFLKEIALTRHVRIHTGERPYQCSVCKKDFNAQSAFTVHLRTHTGERPYKCNYCDKCFIDSGSRSIHHRVHTGENPYVCHLCGKTSKQAQNLKSHLKHAHKISKPTLTAGKNSVNPPFL